MPESFPGNLKSLKTNLTKRSDKIQNKMLQIITNHSSFFSIILQQATAVTVIVKRGKLLLCVFYKFSIKRQCYHFTSTLSVL